MVNQGWVSRLWGRYGLAMVALWAVAAASQAQQIDQRVLAEDGVFSYYVPSDWSVRTVEQSKYKMAFAPLTPGKPFRSNVNIVTEPFADTLDAYLKIAVPKMRQQIPNSRELDAGVFVTTSGMHGSKMVFDNTVQDLPLRQHFYIFQKDGMVYIFCASCLTEEAGTFAPLFDRVARTYAFEKMEKPPVLASVAKIPSNMPLPKERAKLTSDDTKATLEVPVEWSVSEMTDEDNSKYTLAHLTKEKGQDQFSLNILLSVDAFSGTKEAYMDALADQVQQLKGVERQNFPTKNGALGIRVVAPNQNPDGDGLTQVMYVFSTATHKYLVVCTSANNPAAKDVELFDKIVAENFRLQ